MNRRAQLDQWAKDFAALLDPRDAVTVAVEAFDYENAVRVTWTGYDDGHRYTAERKYHKPLWLVRQPDRSMVPANEVLEGLRVRREQAAKADAELGSAVSVPNKVTMDDIEAEIAAEYYCSGAGAFSNNYLGDGHRSALNLMTMCILILHNGAKYVGINYGPVDPAEFNAEDGRKYARQDAIGKLWEPLGFRLRDQRHRDEKSKPCLVKELLPALTQADATVDVAGTPRPDNPGLDTSVAAQSLRIDRFYPPAEPRTCNCGPGDGCTNCLTVTGAELSSAVPAPVSGASLRYAVQPGAQEAFFRDPNEAAKPSTVITPTVGRKVWYRPSGQDHDPMHVIDLNVPLDATVVYVWNDRLVNLLIIDHIGNQHTRTSIHLAQPGDEACPSNGYAEWMPYQVGQARAVEQVAQSSACSTSFVFNGEIPDA